MKPLPVVLKVQDHHPHIVLLFGLSLCAYSSLSSPWSWYIMVDREARTEKGSDLMHKYCNEKTLAGKQTAQ